MKIKNAGHVISKVFFENEQLLIDNMKEKEEFFETAGLLVINEDEKDIKGQYINSNKHSSLIYFINLSNHYYY